MKVNLAHSETSIADLSSFSFTNSKQQSDDNMIPLINIVFLLLIFFMVAGQIKAQPDKAIELPKSTQLASADPLTIRLELHENGKLKFNGEVLEPSKITSLINKNTAAKVALFADGRATAKQLDIVLNALSGRNNIEIKLFTMATQ
ncbi:biopolymer transporter ExbD [Thalassolituus sp.]|uniref:ExbD/TolR family protein n=1 Tax=Thalassolituus sp. TaxID=2030822 RepID=UPI002A8142D4|nr:biopolymer transporter ExbD [Thalassolituus sp.]